MLVIIFKYKLNTDFKKTTARCNNAKTHEIKST